LESPNLSHKIGQRLISWEEFIGNIPSEAIIIYLRQTKAMHKKSSAFVDSKIQRNAPDCYEQSLTTLRPKFSKNVLDKLGVKVVREVCFQFGNVFIEVKWFNKQLLGNYTQSHIMIFRIGQCI